MTIRLEWNLAVQTMKGSKNMERVISNNSTSSLLDHRDDNTHITAKNKIGNTRRNAEPV